MSDKVTAQIMKELARAVLELIREIQKVAAINAQLHAENLELKSDEPELSEPPGDPDSPEQNEQLMDDIWQWKRRIHKLEVKAEDLLIHLESRQGEDQS